MSWEILMGIGEAYEFEKTGRIDPFPTPDEWKSVAVWPDTIKVGNVVGKNESEDTHRSREAAQAVCDLLRKEGFGGEGKVFPISTRVVPVWKHRA